MATENTNERRARTRQEIINLVAKRDTVLSQYAELAKLADAMQCEPDKCVDILDEFCQELIDYMALGHFELYRRIEEGNERRGDIRKLADEIMPRISVTTQVAVDFNDLCEKLDKMTEEVMKSMPAHLNRLGEELATRIELEDRLINTLLASGETTETLASA